MSKLAVGDKLLNKVIWTSTAVPASIWTYGPTYPLISPDYKKEDVPMMDPALACFADATCAGVLVWYDANADGTVGGKQLCSTSSTKPGAASVPPGLVNKQLYVLTDANMNRVCNSPLLPSGYGETCRKFCMLPNNLGTCDEFMRAWCKSQSVTGRHEDPMCSCINIQLDSTRRFNPWCRGVCTTGGYPTAAMYSACGASPVKDPTDDPCFDMASTEHSLSCRAEFHWNFWTYLSTATILATITIVVFFFLNLIRRRRSWRRKHVYVRVAD